MAIIEFICLLLLVLNICYVSHQSTVLAITIQFNIPNTGYLLVMHFKQQLLLLLFCALICFVICTQFYYFSMAVLGWICGLFLHWNFSKYMNFIEYKKKQTHTNNCALITFFAAIA